MEKLLKNLHWAIIAYAVFDFVGLYGTAEEIYTGVETQIEPYLLRQVEKNGDFRGFCV